MPPRLMTAVSLVPPPMSMTMLPTGSSIGQVGADRRGHRLLDEVGVGGAGAAGGVGDGAPFDLGDRRRHADHDLRAGEPADADALQQQPDHPLGDLEVGDRAAPQRPHRDDVAGRAADHLPRLAAGGQHLAGLAVEGDDRRLVEHDAAALHVDERVGGAEVDGEVTSHQRRLSLGWPAHRGARPRRSCCTWSTTVRLASGDERVDLALERRRRRRAGGAGEHDEHQIPPRRRPRRR